VEAAEAEVEVGGAKVEVGEATTSLFPAGGVITGGAEGEVVTGEEATADEAPKTFSGMLAPLESVGKVTAKVGCPPLLLTTPPPAAGVVVVVGVDAALLTTPLTMLLVPPVCPIKLLCMFIAPPVGALADDDTVEVTGIPATVLTTTTAVEVTGTPATVFTTTMDERATPAGAPVPAVAAAPGEAVVAEDAD